VCANTGIGTACRPASGHSWVRGNWGCWLAHRSRSTFSHSRTSSESPAGAL
jgi:hypothetical protein